MLLMILRDCCSTKCLLGENTVVKGGKCGSIHTVKTQFKGAWLQKGFSGVNIMHTFVIKMQLDQYGSLKPYGHHGCERWALMTIALSRVHTGFVCSQREMVVQHGNQHPCLCWVGKCYAEPFVWILVERMSLKAYALCGIMKHMPWNACYVICSHVCVMQKEQKIGGKAMQRFIIES